MDAREDCQRRLPVNGVLVSSVLLGTSKPQSRVFVYVYFRQSLGHVLDPETNLRADNIKSEIEDEAN